MNQDLTFVNSEGAEESEIDPANPIKIFDHNSKELMDNIKKKESESKIF